MRLMNMVLAGLVLAWLSGCAGKQVPPAAGEECYSGFDVVPCPSAGTEESDGASAPASVEGTCATDCASDPNSRACLLCKINTAKDGQIEELQRKQQAGGAPVVPQDQPQAQAGGQPPVIASDPELVEGERSNLQVSSGEQTASASGLAVTGRQQQVALPALVGSVIGETPDRFEAYTYLPSGYERSHRFSVQQVAGADAIVCMWRDGTQLNVRGPEVVVLTNYMIVGEYSYLSGKSIGCTRASSMLFDPTGRDGEIATFVLFKPAVGQAISAGTHSVRVWQAVSRVSYRYSTTVASRTFSSGETEDLRRSL